MPRPPIRLRRRRTYSRTRASRRRTRGVRYSSRSRSHVSFRIWRYSAGVGGHRVEPGARAAADCTPEPAAPCPGGLPLHRSGCAHSFRRITSTGSDWISSPPSRIVQRRSAVRYRESLYGPRRLRTEVGGASYRPAKVIRPVATRADRTLKRMYDHRCARLLLGQVVSVLVGAAVEPVIAEPIDRLDVSRRAAQLGSRSTWAPFHIEYRLDSILRPGNGNTPNQDYAAPARASPKAVATAIVTCSSNGLLSAQLDRRQLCVALLKGSSDAAEIRRDTGCGRDDQEQATMRCEHAHIIPPPGSRRSYRRKIGPAVPHPAAARSASPAQGGKSRAGTRT